MSGWTRWRWSEREGARDEATTLHRQQASERASRREARQQRAKLVPAGYHASLRRCAPLCTGAVGGPWPPRRWLAACLMLHPLLLLQARSAPPPPLQARSAPPPPLQAKHKRTYDGLARLTQLRLLLRRLFEHLLERPRDEDVHRPDLEVVVHCDAGLDCAARALCAV